MVKAKVIMETYRATIDGSEHKTAAQAIAHTYRILADETGKPGWTTGGTVERVTHHEPIDQGFFGVLTETVTGKIIIDAPGRLEMSRPELSRYSPVNGWVVPETIDVDL